VQKWLESGRSNHAADHQTGFGQADIAARLIDIQLHRPLAGGIRARTLGHDERCGRHDGNRARGSAR